jgi:hypothetical protein
VHAQSAIALTVRIVRIAPTVRAAPAAVRAAVRAPQVNMVHVLNHRSAICEFKVVTVAGFLEDCTLNNPLLFYLLQNASFGTVMRAISASGIRSHTHASLRRNGSVDCTITHVMNTKGGAPMGKICTLALGTLTVAVAISQVAVADVSAISLRFGGGCRKTNTTGSCTIKPRYSGFDLASETAVLYTCISSRGGCRKYSSRLHPVSEAGEISMRIRNIPGGCFQVRTGPNGNDKPDVKSPILCEK